jgi:hypothetical protein
VINDWQNFDGEDMLLISDGSWFQNLTAATKKACSHMLDVIFGIFIRFERSVLGGSRIGDSGLLIVRCSSIDDRMRYAEGEKLNTR